MPRAETAVYVVLLWLAASLLVFSVLSAIANVVYQHQANINRLQETVRQLKLENYACERVLTYYETELYGGGDVDERW